MLQGFRKKRQKEKIKKTNKAMNNKKILPIVWKQSTSGETAYCGNRKIGWVKQSLAKKDEFFVTILNDVVTLKENKRSTMEEGKHVVEKVFYDVISSMLAPE